MAFLPSAFSTRDLATSKPPELEEREPGRGIGEFVKDGFLLVAAGVAHAGDFDGDELDLLGFELGHQLRRLVGGQAGEEDGGFADGGGGHGGRSRRSVVSRQ